MKIIVKAVTMGICLLVCLMGLATSVFAAEWNITGSTFSHDPTVIRESGLWWQFYTADGIGVKYSNDGRQWNQGVQIFNSSLSWWRNYVPDKNDFNIWAPDIFHHNNRYWLYYSVSTFGSNTSCIGLVSCSSILQGDWRDDGMVIRSTSSNNYNAIDPGIVRDAYGNLWMSFGSFWSGIKLVRIDGSTMKPTGSIYSLASRPGVQNNPIEGAKIVYHNGYYYLFVAFDYCCQGADSTYKIAYGRATSITGPYYDRNGVNMMNGGGTILDQSTARWRGPGAPEPFDTGNGWIMVHHAYDAYNNGTATLRIKDLYWDASGWPSYTGGTGPTPTPRPTSTSTPGPTPTPTPGGDVYYKIRNRGNNQMYLDGMGRTSNGSDAGQWRSSSSYNQQWRLEHVTGNYYKIVNRATNLCLDSMGRTDDHSILGQWESSSHYNQQWELIELSGGYVKFKNRATGKCIDNGAHVNNGDPARMWYDNTHYNQQWVLIQ